MLGLSSAGRRFSAARRPDSPEGLSYTGYAKKFPMRRNLA
jgi:hypothetical protein